MPKRKSAPRPLPVAPEGTVGGSWQASSAGGAPGGGAPSAPSPPPAPKGRHIRTTVPTVVDMGKAREEALFQLRLGRQSLAFGFIAGLLLIVDSAIALFVGTSALASAGSVSPFLGAILSNQPQLILPLAAALFLSIMVFVEKYDTYGFWPFEDHFALTVASLVLAVVLAAVYGLHFTGKAPGLLNTLQPVIYILVLTSLSLGMVSLGTTWRGWPIRKIASVVFGVLPPLFAIPLSFALTPLANVGAPGMSGAFNLQLSIELSFAAFLYTASGAQLHLMASATRAQEREVVAGSHEKLFALSQELATRSEAALFREEALARREADVEAQEGSLVERARFLEDRRSELETLDRHLRQKSDEIGGREQGLLPRAAEVTAAEGSLKERNAQMAAREHELQSGFQRLGDREKNLLEREQGTRQKELDLQNRSSEVARQEAQSRVLEQTAQSRLAEAERRFAGATAREAEVRAKESSMVLPPDARSRVQAKEQEILRREAAIEAQRAEVQDRANASTQKEQAVERRRLELQQVASTILEREKQVANREATISAKEKQYEVELDLLKGATKRHEEEIRRYFDATKKSTLVESQSSLMMNQLKEKETGFSLREQKLLERERETQSKRVEAERLAQEAAAQRRALEAQTADLRLRSTRLEEAAARLSAAKPAVADEQLSQALRDREKALELRERQLSDREQKIRAMAYERDRQAAAASAEDASGGISIGPTTVTQRVPGKVSTGTPRLDDLLLGGVPEKAHVALVGPSFVGKEVAIYAFLAEGLRKGEGALIVSTARAPGEIAKELGVVVPSLMEYEGAGRVIWVDASNPAGVPSGDSRSQKGSTVKGPGDQVGILQAIHKHSAELDKAGSFRVAFLSLSACITQTDEKGAAAFVQNVLGTLRTKRSIGAYSVERGMHSEQQVQAIVSQMDGAIVFQTERGKNQLQVLGLGEVQSRQWVDYRFTQRALQLGSFSLERIR
ncbi:MAG: hypothetical protein KGJ23_10240 [Euryarchaeota archaeon]|nr:hypothetical protein [Euryarchaeota archaeon]MDE1836984.1 hypothetical protein [Euryarchaeota archaeon]MDE1881573.1 hypothetical protein [Euryarchaeota archaeon]MDE2046360.1 hypothetical protein [Thermoplasmata archaeon]